jgi:MFS family permease
MPARVETLPPHYRRNFAAFVVDYVFFGIALGFMNLSSVVPAFVRQLTASAPVIGLSSTLFAGGFQLPQSLFAHFLGDKPRKRPYMLLGAPGRLVLWVFAAALWAGLGRRPAAMLMLFILGMVLFAASDGLITIMWFDIMARTIPPQRRGRMIGLAQIISGIAGIGVGTLVGLILSAPYRQPLAAYALLFFLAGASMVPSTIALALIWEPPPQAEDEVSRSDARGGMLRAALRDPAFVWLVVCRLLVSGVDMATPFYVGHAQDWLHLPARLIGGFVIAQTLGSIVSSVVLGAVSERHGAITVIRITSAVAPVGPLIALALHGAGAGSWLWAYPLTYAVIGVVYSAWMLGFANYTLEIAPKGQRPAYIGLANTICGIAVVMPTLGGLVLQRSSYPVLFGLAAAVGALGFLSTWGLKAPAAAADGV